MSRLEEFVQKFKQHSYKMTPQRWGILEVLIGNTPHPTAEQIHGLVGDFEKVKSLFPCDGFRPVRYAVTIYGYCADYAAPLETES